jgi:hypothetical protein
MLRTIEIPKTRVDKETIIYLRRFSNPFKEITRMCVMPNGVRIMGNGTLTIGITITETLMPIMIVMVIEGIRIQPGTERMCPKILTIEST